MVAVVAGVLVTAPLASCGANAADQVNYATDGRLTTYNTNTVAGAASAGPRAFARALTGFGYHGPDGQIIADHDFGTVSVVGREPLLLDYAINDGAVYSDGKPVVCDDMVLAWASQSGRLPGFDAASRAGYADIEKVDCVPGEKKARVTFAPNRRFIAFPELFTATSMMPSHVIADELDVDVTSALQNNDVPVVEQIAKAWNTIWDLNPDVDLGNFPSSGPYKLESVRPDGAVVLVANDRWWGPKAITQRVTVFPQGIEVQDRIDNGSFDVVDIAAGSSGTVTIPDDYEHTDTPSAGIEQLIFAGKGQLAEPSARRALALCTPRDLIAANAGVPIANARLNPVNDDAFAAAESSVDGDQYIKAEPAAARGALENAQLTIRIGYQSPNARLAAVVGTIARACAPAGVVVQEVASENTGPLSLKDNQIDVLLASTGGAAGSGSTGSSAMDAFALHTGNGNNLSGYSNPEVDSIIDRLAATADPKEVAQLLTDGARILWADMPTLPLYRQQRSLITSMNMYGATNNPTRWGSGWNMDRWVLSR